MRPFHRTVLLLALALAGCSEPEDTDTDTGSADTGSDDTDTDSTVETPANQAPVAAADAVATDEDTPTVTIQPKANDSDPDGDPLDITAIDTTGTTGTVTLGADDVITWQPGSAYQTLGADAVATDTFAYTVSDGALTATGTVTVTITGTNDAPILTGPANQTHDEGTLVNLQVIAADPDAAALSWQATNLPPGLSIGPATGRIQGRISAAASSVTPYAVTVTVSDGLASDDATFAWTVVEANVPPIFDPVDDQSHAEGAAVSLTVAATDPEGATPSYSAVNLPPGLSIGTVSGTITGTVGYTAAAGSPYTVTLRASDGDTIGETQITWTIANTNRTPDLSPPDDQSDAEGDTVNLAVTATDPDADALTWGASGLPSGLSIHPSTGVISGTLGYTSAGTATVTVTVTDGTDGEDGQFTWTVANTNRAPVINGPSDRSNAENEVVNVTATGSDPDGTALTWSAQGLPPGLSIASNGAISGRLTFDSAGSHAVTLTASDGAASTDHTFTWTVSPTNRPPVGGSMSGRLDEEGDAVSFTVPASDPDGDALSFQATGLPAGVSIHPDTGAITGTLPYTLATSGTASFAVTVTVDDGVATDTIEFDWDVDHVNRAPTVKAVADRTDAEGAAIDFALEVSDPDGDSMTNWTATGLPPGVALVFQGGAAAIRGTLAYDAAPGPYTVTVTAYDATLSDAESFTWNVTDVEGPLCERQFDDVTIAAGLDKTGTASAVLWLDADQDGRQDVFLRNSDLWLADGEGYAAWGLEDPGTGALGGTVGDANLDGWPDLFVPNVSQGRQGPQNRLYVGSGFKGAWEGFDEQAQVWDVQTTFTNPGAAAFVDADGDADHDLSFVVDSGNGHFWWNEQFSPFDDEKSMFNGGDLAGQHLAWADFDDDGCQDLLVSDLDQLQLFVCDGIKGEWQERANDYGLDVGVAGAGWGAPTWVDLNGDGFLDLHIVMVGGKDVVFYQDRVKGEFVFDDAGSLGLGDSERGNTSAVWADVDLDGHLDVLLVDKGLYRAKGDGFFEDVTQAVGYQPAGVQAAAWADRDGDGDLDLLAVGEFGARLYDNGPSTKQGACSPGGSVPIAALTDADGSAKGTDEQPDFPSLGARIVVDLDGDGDFAADPDKGSFVAVYLVGQAQTGRAAANQVPTVIGLGKAEKLPVRVVFTDGDVVEDDAAPSTTPAVFADP